MTHYDVLGVAPDASDVDIRRAYVALARTHHPDHHLDEGAEERARAERRMQAINAAWRELSDPERRRRYDEGLSLGLRDAVVEDEPVRAWRPYDEGWDVDDDLDPRLDDSAARRPTGARLLAVLPVASLVLGVAAVVVGGVANLRPLVAFGLIGLAVALLLFVAAPIAVVLESRRHDRL